MTEYKCHKVVQAAKITVVGDASADGSVSLGLEGGDTIVVDAAWMTRNPEVAEGGYYVIYPDSDNYSAYSPAGPFESGYSPSEDTTVTFEPQFAVKNGPHTLLFHTQADFDLYILGEGAEIRGDSERHKGARALAGGRVL